MHIINFFFTLSLCQCTAFVNGFWKFHGNDNVPCSLLPAFINLDNSIPNTAIPGHFFNDIKSLLRQEKGCSLATPCLLCCSLNVQVHLGVWL